MPFQIPAVTGHQMDGSVKLVASQTAPPEGKLVLYIEWLQDELALAKAAYQVLTGNGWDVPDEPKPE